MARDVGGVYPVLRGLVGRCIDSEGPAVREGDVGDLGAGAGVTVAEGEGE